MSNWSNPQLTSTYTNFVTEVKDRDIDLAKQFDGQTVSNLVTGTIRWDSSANRWKKWTGSAWGELASTYALTNVSTTGTGAFGGNVTISGTLDVTTTLTGASFIPDGSTVPSNGMYLPSANTLGFSSNGSARIHITSSGDVGINDSTPSAKLDVGGGIKATGASGYTFNSNDTDGGMFSPADDKLEFKTNNTTRLTISGSRIGIGDTTPDELFHVHNASASATNIKISNTEGSVFIRADGDEANYDADGHRFRNESGSTIARIDTANTRLGIGTGSPTKTLHVAGTAKVTGAAEFDGAVTVTGALNATTSLATDVALTGTNALLLQSANNNTTTLGNGTDGQFLKTRGTSAAPEWTSLGGTIPVGGIIIWSGASNAIPSGWALCDGTGTTPDLRNRFVVGAGSTYSVGGEGGSANAITVAHTHSTNTTGSHGHGASTNSTGNHTHNYTDDDHQGNATSLANWGVSRSSSMGGGGSSGGGTQHGWITSSNGAHSHTVSVNSGGNHSHTVNSTGSSGTNANLPPYFALCYIMRTS